MPESFMAGRRRILQLGIAGIGLAATGPLLAACSASDGSLPGPANLDPHGTILAGDVYTLNQIFEPLYLTAVDGSLQPHLATGHTVSPDGKTYTFALRPKVTFSDGSPLTSADVVYSLKRAQSSKGPLSFLDGVISSVTAAGDLSVVVRLTQAWSPFTSDISAFSNSIVPDDLQGKPAAEFFAKPVGTGPFTLESWVKGGTVTLAANPKYWNAPGPYLDKVEFTVVQDENQLVQQLQAGQVDVIDTVPPANFTQIIQASLKQIGVTISIRSIEDAAYQAAFQKFDFDLFIDIAINDISDPDEMASFELDETDGGSNSYWTHYSDPATTALVRQAETEPDSAKRQRLYGQIQQKVADDVPFVPLSYPAAIKGLGSHVQGFKVNPAGAVRLKEVWLA
ncbi:ABC transporter substrate-binding protein [Amycolatopsis saalfeldensis]|uniref:Extracellular solute-binding protein, family 5 Middle n=1 Tax=Amycolatopsis saalfeldensis TaxID=394193 RepID=A0A1H8VKF8_9PSEU|nr:ABC transporter substrate-binding protein [Amycolatopsis saalfeldensis]SEP15388.1 extracellular solute-binding protein, family 5 Middle [Amycolatopsis saalfeldensis]